MCVMASVMYSGEPRHAVFKRLLRGASPQNPTYILGRVIAEFQAQSPTELTVRKGDEIFILFEINEWAFATVFSDTTRKGYVPLDYCDIIRDFYEQPDAGSKVRRSSSKCQKSKGSGSQQVKDDRVTANQQVKDDRVSGSQQVKDDRVSGNQQVKDDRVIDELRYYKSKLLQSTGKVNTAHRLGEDNSKSSQSRPNSTQSNLTNPLKNYVRFGELYKEQTTPNADSDIDVLKNCCCCCDRRRCRRSKLDQYNNVLHYINGAQPLADSHLEDSESGLGDSESILSFCDIPLASSSVKTDVYDMATQTSKSLEDLQDHIDKLSLTGVLHETPGSSKAPSSHKQPYCAEEKYRDSSENKFLSQSTSTRLSPPPSADSSSTDSGFKNNPTDVSTVKSDSDGESNSSFNREDYATVKRKHRAEDKNTPKVVSSLECNEKEDNPSISSKSLGNTKSQQMECDLSSVARYRHLSATDLKRRLSIPILEEGKRPNRVELTRLSMRIKEKLRPARDELLQKRTEKKQQQESMPISKPPQSAVSTKMEIDRSWNKTSDNLTKSNPETHNKEIKEREITFQSIQQQYMKLEEARLLHNALKQLNNVIAVQGPDTG